MGYDRIERKDATGLDKPEVSAELKSMLKDAHNALQAIESKSEDTKVKALDALKKINDLSEDYGEKHRRWEAALKAAETKAADAETRVKDLEVKVATGAGGGSKPDYFDMPEVKAFYGMWQAMPGSQKLRDSITDLQKKEMELKDAGLLRTDNMTQGGYLVPPVTANRVIEKMIEFSPVRALAAGMPLATKTMSVPTEKAIPDSYYEGEAEDAAQGTLQFGEETVQAWRHTVYMTMTYDQLLLSPFDMESRMTSSIGKSFAKKEGWMLVNGSGRNQPQGFLKHSDTATAHTITSAATQTVTWNDLANLMGAMKTGYNPMFLFNRLTFAQLVQIKDGYGRPLWTPVAGDKPATIWDQPYSSRFIDMDSMLYVDGTKNGTSNTLPIVYADLGEAYMNFDVQGMRVIRDDVTQATKNIIKYTFSRYHTAKVVKPEAIKVLKVK